MHNWYVVQTKPRQETIAVENLERQGYVTYCPQMAQAKRRRQRWQKVIEPLFPRYLFVKLAIEPLFPRYLFVKLAIGIDDFAPIRSTIGVLNMVRFGGQPATISQQAIDNIQKQEQVLLAEPGEHPHWQAGDRVQVIDGPFAGLNGIFQKLNSQERVIILLNLLGQENSVAVKMNSIVPAM
jgi:transcriptional antiterminator RfaH